MLLFCKDLTLAKSAFSSKRWYDKDWISLIKHRLQSFLRKILCFSLSLTVVTGNTCCISVLELELIQWLSSIVIYCSFILKWGKKNKNTTIKVQLNIRKQTWGRKTFLKKKWWQKEYYAAKFYVCVLHLWKVLVISV